MEKAWRTRNFGRQALHSRPGHTVVLRHKGFQIAEDSDFGPQNPRRASSRRDCLVSFFLGGAATIVMSFFEPPAVASVIHRKPGGNQAAMGVLIICIIWRKTTQTEFLRHSLKPRRQDPFPSFQSLRSARLTRHNKLLPGQLPVT